MEQPDLIIIGAGVLGLFHAYFAARRGLKVRVLERNTFPNDASIRNFGMLPQSIVPAEGAWAEIVRDSSNIYQQIQAEHDISITNPGTLYLASTALENAVLQEFADRYGDRCNCEYLPADEVRYRYPMVRSSYCSGGLVFPHDLALDPAQMARRLIAYLESRLGVQYEGNTTVVRVARSGNGCVVQTAGGENISAERVIVCSGAECRLLFPQVFGESGLQVCKLQMMRSLPQPDLRLPHSILSGLSIRRYPAFTGCPSYAALLVEPTGHDLAAYGIHVLFKQSLDGSIIIGDSHQYRPAWDRAPFEERTDPAINDTILGYARGMLDLPTWTVNDLWNGFYLSHPERAVYSTDIDEQIHLVTGIGGKGMTTSPGFARWSIARILGDPEADSPTARTARSSTP